MSTYQEWTLESALTVLEHKTVDAKLWSEAVEWLILHGPVELRELLLQASGQATHDSFPELKARGYSPDGQPCYNIKELATHLNISEDEARQLLLNKQKEHGIPHFIDEDDTSKVQ
ncbi:MAG: hypothetical protein H8E79_02220 [Desulfobulbaceae bacterium]|uniref:Uncharacterized protein n=1 Tax=Candidatus Desulfatifera sulfidica TaxID=2841691 RepID=A0A8J6TD59_9BACT|nr:hypothetical protein [Candidatus Desulfatifera sulfidica]